MEKNEKEIKKGDVYFARLPEADGSVQTGTRPIIVVQNDIGNKHSATVIVVPVTSHDKKSFLPTHLVLDSNEFNFFTYKSNVAIAEQIITLDKKNLINKLGQIGLEKMQQLNKCLSISLGLEV